jgi:protein O-GlcNAc transferase
VALLGERTAMSTTTTRERPAAADPHGRDGLRRLLQRYYEGRNELRRGLCLLTAGRHDDAVRAFTAAQRINPNHLALPKYLAAAYLGQGRFRQAADQLYNVVCHAPADVAGRIRHALALWKSGATEQAVASFRDGIRENPESAELHFQLATLLATLGETDEAELRFTQAVNIDKHHAEALVGLGLCHGTRGNPQAAVRCLQRAQAENPCDARTALLLAYAARAVSPTVGPPIRVAIPAEVSPADTPGIDELAALIAADPDFVEGFLSLDPDDVGAEVFAMLAVTLQRALEHSPEHADLHYHCGCVLTRLGRTGDAIAAIERAVDLRPQFTQALIQLAKLYQQTERHPDARRRLEDAIRQGAEYADVYCLLGHLYREGGMVDRAREAFERALTINPQYSEARAALQAVSV